MTTIDLLEDLVHIRDIEQFNGPILSEWKSSQSGLVYVEKWCDQDDIIVRSLFVRTESDLIDSYLKQNLSLWDLMHGPDGFGFMVDRYLHTKIVANIESVTFDKVNSDYWSQPEVFHDPDLRPR